jgi:uncharacterized membrane protein
MTIVLPKPDVETSIWIARPPEDIWEYWYDVSNETQWRGGVITSQWTSEPPHGVGSTGLHVVKGTGDWPWRVTDWEDLRSMSWDITGGRFEGAHAGYRIAPEDDGSRVTIHIRVKQSVLMRILMLIMKRRMRAQLAADLEKLKAVMEA